MTCMKITATLHKITCYTEYVQVQLSNNVIAKYTV